MNDQKWSEICKQIEPHLEAIRKIARENNLGILCMSTKTDTTNYFNAFVLDGGKSYDFSNFDGKSYIRSCMIGG